MSELSPLSEAEIRKEIASLTVGERTKLIKHAGYYSWSEQPDELVQEVIYRVLAGKRKWPRGLEKVTFLTGVIKSIAGDRTRALNRESAALKKLKKEEMEKEKQRIAGDKGAAERDAADEIDLERIMALFDDDLAAQQILRGMADGARGKDLQQASGLSPTEYESKRTKIRRRIEKFVEKSKT
jgi:DNA-directed RNA polymerase specialized sigma24 family protein